MYINYRNKRLHMSVGVRVYLARGTVDNEKGRHILAALLLLSAA